MSRFTLSKIRRAVQDRLADDSLNFYQKIDSDEIEIEESKNENRAKDTLKQVAITDINCQNFENIWRLNLESEVQGLSTNNKTVEIAIITLDKKI